MTTIDVDLLAPEVMADPHPLMHRLRAEDPVHWSDRHRGWLLTRYDDVAAGFRDARLSADRMTPMFERLEPATRATVALAERHLTRWLVFMDPPGHDRLRRLVSRAFTPPRMNALRAEVRELVASLLAEWDGGDDVAFHATFALPLPATVVAMVLGAPVADRGRFFRWSADVSAVVFGTGGDPARFERAQRGLGEFDAYVRAFADDVRASARPPTGLIADLVAVHDQGDRLDTDELVATATLLLFAGQETTTTLLGNAIAVLDGAPGARTQLADAPSMAATAVEELMRYAGPTKLMVRTATDDVELPSGGRLPRGDRVYLVVAAANRDPSRFARPDELDLTRADNLHLGFGSGIHHCLGAPLARIEAQEALAALYTTYPDLTVCSDIRWGGGLLGRAVAPLTVRPGRPATVPRARPTGAASGG